MEKASAQVASNASILRGSNMIEDVGAKGKYFIKCYDKDGNLKWEDIADNVVCDAGANQLLNSAFDSGPVDGPYLGLISSVGYTGIPLAADTMLSHSATGHVWNEAGNGSNYPNWSTPSSNARATVSFATASGRAKALSSAVSFVIATNGGTVEGCFLVFGTSAVATNGDTGGVLYSAGIFSGGAKTLSIGDTLQVSYSTSI
jgi:hypothetical protein